MDLIKLKCPQCGSDLEVNSKLNEMICNYCGTKILINDEATKIERIANAKINERKSMHEQEMQELKDKDDFKRKKENRELKQIFLILACVFGSMILLALLIGLTTSELSYKCSIGDQKYVVVVHEKEGITCGLCDEELINELNAKCYIEKDINTSTDNVKAYFENKGGKCEY